RPHPPPPFPSTTLFRSTVVIVTHAAPYEYPNIFGDESLEVGPFLIRPDYLAILISGLVFVVLLYLLVQRTAFGRAMRAIARTRSDRKSTRLNSSHDQIA